MKRYLLIVPEAACEAVADALGEAAGKPVVNLSALWQDASGECFGVAAGMFSPEWLAAVPEDHVIETDDPLAVLQAKGLSPFFDGSD